MAGLRSEHIQGLINALIARAPSAYRRTTLAHRMPDPNSLSEITRWTNRVLQNPHTPKTLDPVEAINVARDIVAMDAQFAREHCICGKQTGICSLHGDATPFEDHVMYCVCKACRARCREMIE